MGGYWAALTGVRALPITATRKSPRKENRMKTVYGARNKEGQYEVITARVDVVTPDDSSDDPVRMGEMPIGALYK
jgi:hypothetical protein